MLQRAMFVAAFLSCAFAARAQNVQPVLIKPIQAPIASAPNQIDQAALEKARLERENKRLKEENAALKKQVDDFSALGGSNVHAYCANETTSRTTAGAEASCSANLKCDQISGMCKTSCTTSADCATGSCEICGTDTQGVCTALPTSRCH